MNRKTAHELQRKYALNRAYGRMDGQAYAREIQENAHEKWARFRSGTFEFPVEMFTNNPPCRMLGLN